MTIMNATQTGTQTGRPAERPTAGSTGTSVPGMSGTAGRPGGDPRVGWSSNETPRVPTLRHRRDGILPTVAAALSVRGATLTGTAARGDQPPALHPLVQDFLDTLTSAQRDRSTGRCAEALLISRQIAFADEARSRRAARKPMTNGEARRALKQAKLTARRIREDGDPLHGSFAAPCRSCTALSDHFGVRIVDPSAPTG
ncbi:YwqJ-related putative deaminase [Streptomyces sp. NBC_00576]|uniref:YwqJ-related putative deaminase n=1 Tax=Streptomyces sp. NBC_00576 TaxID=2903665 RepID=UPI002E80F6CF|nr:YwqJ-related putative deaminase [Streptomyces sp. NBC_00576]WUB71863.1 YwqJ-related putative deaminase [Streptomyces sp. NBC_00576]